METPERSDGGLQRPEGHGSSGSSLSRGLEARNNRRDSDPPPRWVGRTFSLSGAVGRRLSKHMRGQSPVDELGEKRGK